MNRCTLPDYIHIYTVMYNYTIVYSTPVEYMTILVNECCCYDCIICIIWSACSKMYSVHA